MYKLLIVDDEYEIRTTLVNNLPWDDVGFVVAGQAADGTEAQAFVEGHAVDVVLCDIRMPKMSGLEFARWAHETRKPFKLVFLSAYRRFEYAQEALRYGVRRYLVKPPAIEEFLAFFKDLARELDAGQAASKTEAGVDPIVETVTTYVVGNPANATIEEAARLVKMNSHYLSTYFREKAGETFSTLLLKTRMEKAAALLRDRQYLTAEVSLLIGYTSPKNFTRAFRRYFGMPPKDFRRFPEGPRLPPMAPPAQPRPRDS